MAGSCMRCKGHRCRWESSWPRVQAPSGPCGCACVSTYPFIKTDTTPGTLVATWEGHCHWQSRWLLRITWNFLPPPDASQKPSHLPHPLIGPLPIPKPYQSWFKISPHLSQKWKWKSNKRSISCTFLEVKSDSMKIFHSNKKIQPFFQ